MCGSAGCLRCGSPGAGAAPALPRGRGTDRAWISYRGGRGSGGCLLAGGRTRCGLLHHRGLALGGTGRLLDRLGGLLDGLLRGRDFLRTAFLPALVAFLTLSSAAFLAGALRAVFLVAAFFAGDLAHGLLGCRLLRGLLRSPSWRRSSCRYLPWRGGLGLGAGAGLGQVLLRLVGGLLDRLAGLGRGLLTVATAPLAVDAIALPMLVAVSATLPAALDRVAVTPLPLLM